MATRPSHRSVPLSVYVVWHPRFADGAALARSVYSWLGSSRSDLRRVGMGIEVHFRSEDWQRSFALPGDPLPDSSVPTDAVSAADHAAQHRARRPIAFGEADVDVIVPLVDAHMLTDRSWRRDLRTWADLHRDEGGVRLAPVQLVPSFEALGPVIDGIQPVQVDTWRDLDEPEDDAARRTRRGVRLRRELVQFLLRILTEFDPHSDGDGRPLRRVFLSHAKEDKAAGAGVAERLRDVGRAYGHIETFYDDNELIPGRRGWTQATRRASARGEAFVAVLSDQYAARSWTRAELSQARTPQVDAELPERVSVWTVRPTVAVTTLQDGWSQIPDDLATVPVMRFAPGREEEVFDHLLREAVVQAWQLKWADKVARRWAARSPDERRAYTDLHILTWTPDRPTLAALRAEARRRRAWPSVAGRRVLVAYPGFGFLPGEEQRLERDFGSEIHLCSFHDLLVGGDEPQDPHEGHRLWLSVGDPAGEELAARGYDAGWVRQAADVLSHTPLRPQQSLHLDSLMLRLVQRLLPRTDLAYGRALRMSWDCFDDLLLDILTDRTCRRESEVGDRPLWNFTAWPACSPREPVHQRRLADLRARHVHACRFYDIAPVGESLLQPLPAPKVEADSLAPADAWRAATALSRMRHLAAQHTDATVLVAGRIAGSAGLMPGIVEELLWSLAVGLGGAEVLLPPPPDGDPADLAHRQEVAALCDRLRALRPKDVGVVLVGEYGGAARLVVQAVMQRVQATETPPLPPMLTLHGQLAHPAAASRLRVILEGGGGAGQAHAAQCYAALEAAVEGLAGLLQRHSPDTLLPGLGIDIAEWVDLMTASGVERIGAALMRVRPDRAHTRRSASARPTDRRRRLEGALASTLAELPLPSGVLSDIFPAAWTADRRSLARMVELAARGDVGPRALATALRAHLGSDNTLLWRALVTQRVGGEDAVARALASEGLDPSALFGPVEDGRAEVVPGRLGVHLVWDRDDEPTAALVDCLTDTLHTLGDGVYSDGRPAVGEGVAVRHLSFASWPPPKPALDEFTANLVVVLLHADLPGGPARATASPWARQLSRADDTRISVVVRIPESQLSPMPAGVSAGGPWAVMWSEAAPPTQVRPTIFDDVPSVGPQDDVMAAVLWGVVHALRPGTATGQQRLPVVSDGRGSLPTVATAFERRACLARFVSGPSTLDPSLAGRVIEPGWAVVPFGVNVATPADVHIVAVDTAAAWRGAAVPRVVVGPSQQLDAALDWTGPGRLTVRVSSERPEDALLGAHLVAARQAWLQACLDRVYPGFPEWETVVAPSLLGLCGAALKGQRWVLVPEPMPSAADRQQLAEMASSTGLTVHSPTSVHGELLRGWTVHLVVLPPEPDNLPATGLSAAHGARVRTVLQAVFRSVGAKVHIGSTPDALARTRLGPRQQLFVLCGVPSGGPSTEAWLAVVRTLVTAHAHAVYPLGLTGGLFGRDSRPLAQAWPRALSRISEHNGLGLAGTEALARTVDIWPAARRMLDGVGHLLS